jgi:ABC-type antimicrobial peptide transport system permease subunit
MSDESPFRSLLLPTSTDCISLTGHVASDQQLHGVTAYTVVRRTPEIGIRMALRAERGGVIAMVMRGAVIQTVLGLTIEIPVALLCVRFVKALYEVTRADASVMMSAIVTLAGAACLAGVIPTRRAASIDPVQALRTE